MSEPKSLLKFITCGSVDDGKSTLIGHMLYDAKLLFTDHARALELDSKVGSRGGEIDYSLLLDGLMAEREQGITIDVAYRYFTTTARSFIVADCPGHEQYTRNMAVGASFAELAVILVDAAHGVCTQTRRHARICALMGIRHFVLAVNKMDLVGYDFQLFNAIEQEFRNFTAGFGLSTIQVIPVSATVGDNVVTPSPKMPWYSGLPLLGYLEEIDIGHAEENTGFLMPVQRVCRPDHTFRGFQGEVESGMVQKGDEITVSPSGEKARVQSILVGDRPADIAACGQPATLQLDREIDISRGNVLFSGRQVETSSVFRATVLWMDDSPLIAGRGYLMKCGTQTVAATISSIRRKLDIDTGEEHPADRIFKNELAYCEITLAYKIPLEKFSACRVLGSFILIDRVSHMTSACGVVEHTMRRSQNVVWQPTEVTREVRARQKEQAPLTLWFTGLSGSGKSALANALEKRLVSIGKHTALLDGDNIRHGLCRDLGFTEADRVENIRRVAEVARLMNDAGLIVLTAFISPYRQDRQSARDIIGDSFVEVYLSTPLEECERRDVKGLYKKARKGEIPNFTGISAPYEAPEKSELEIDTSKCTVDEAVEQIVHALKLD